MNNPRIPSVSVRNMTLKAGDPKICVSITGRTRDDILDSCREIVRARADIVEWRVDFFKEYTNDFLLKDTLAELRRILGDIPLIFTIRTVEEGGLAEIRLLDYIRTYRECARSGLADIFDIEYKIMLQLPREVVADISKNARVIVSKHNFNSTPDLETLIDDIIRLQVSGGDIAKLAVMPEDEEDAARLIKASKEIIAHYTTTPIITISMGALGIDSRAKCVETGSCITFGCVGRPSAPGQLPIQQLRDAVNRYKFVK